MHHDDVAFHNVAELRETDDDGRALQRVPEDVREHLNEGAQLRMTVPSSSEIRFVSSADTVTVSLSSPGGEATVVPFWGPFQGGEPLTVGPEPAALELSYPEQLRALDADALGDRPFSPRVWRLRFGYDVPGPLHYHGVEGDVRPPRETEVPGTRYLAYGTSITDGAAATRDHLTYPARAARELGADLLNLGSGGSAFCEREIADHIAGRDDWDVATLSISVNMLGAGFSVDEFRDRATYMVEAVAGRNPDRPVVAITPFPLFVDLDDSLLPEEWGATPAEYRGALREVVAAAGLDNLHLVEGPDLMTDVGGHTPDVLHPGDAGMIEIGQNLAAELDDVVS